MRRQFGWLLCLALAACANPVWAGDKEIDASKPQTVKGEVKDDDKIEVMGKPLVGKQYKVKFEEGKSYKITMDATDPGFDSFLVIVNKDGRVVAANDDIAAGNLNSMINFTAPAGGGPFKLITAAFDGKPGAFVLKIEPAKATGGKVEGKEMDVGKGLKLTGTLSEEKKAITYAIKLKEGKSYKIDMQGDFDTYIEVRGPDGKILAQDDDGGEGLNSRLVFRAPANGTFRIVATSFMQAHSGNYTLEVREE